MADEDAHEELVAGVPDVLGPKHFVTKFGRSAYLCPAPVRIAKHRIRAESLAHVTALCGAKNVSAWSVDSLTLAHFHVFLDKPAGRPKAFFSLDYSDLPASDIATLDSNAKYIDDHVAWPVPKSVGPALAEELKRDDIYYCEDDDGKKRLKDKWCTVIEALEGVADTVSPQEGRWQKFPLGRFVTRREFPKTSTGSRSNETDAHSHEVVTGEVVDVPAGCMGTTFVPFAAPGVSVQVVHRGTGLVVYQFPGAPLVGGGVKRPRGEDASEE